MMAAGRIALRRLAWSALVLTAVYWLLRTPLVNGGWRTGDLNDYTLNLRHCRTIDATAEYPFGFTYPPPSVVARLCLDRLGAIGGSAVWLTLEFVGFWAALLALFAARKPTAACRWAAVAAGFALKWAWEFEFKYVNGNYIFLLLTTGFFLSELRGWKFAAGGWLAASIAFKLYSAVFVPFLILERRWRTAAWTLLWSGVWWVALPGWWWGPTKSVAVAFSWRQAVAETEKPDFPRRFEAYLVSIPKAILDVAEDRRIAVDSVAVRNLAIAVSVLWMSATLGAWLYVRRRIHDPKSAWAFDWAFLLTWPLAASPQLQPHHLACLTPAAVWTLRSAFEHPRTRRSATIVAAIVGAWALLEFCPQRSWRGPCTLTAIALLQACLLWSTRDADPSCAPATARRLEHA